MSWHRRLALVAATIGAMASCRQVIGLGDEPVVERCAESNPTSPACGSCLEASCCAELADCEADATCASWLSCFAACADDDGACRAECDGSRSLTSAGAALRACMASTCAAPCQVSCGVVPPGTGCDDCASGCCAEALRREQSLDAQSLRACLDACGEGDGDCSAACRQAYPAGASLDQQLAQCVDLRCDITADLSCVGVVAWPESTANEGTLFVNMNDLITAEDAAEVTIEACSHNDPACSPPPWGTYVTNAQGEAPLTVDLPYYGFLRVAGPGWVPALWYLVPPAATDTVLDLRILRETSLAGITQTAGITLDPDRGHLFLETLDCDRLLARDMTIAASTADGETTIVYVDETLFDLDAEATDESGRAGVLNLPPGLTTIEVSQDRTCERIATVDVLVQAGATTLLQLPPTP